MAGTELVKVKLTQDVEEVSGQYRHVIRMQFMTADCQTAEEDLLRVAAKYSERKCGPIVQEVEDGSERPTC